MLLPESAVGEFRRGSPSRGQAKGGRSDHQANSSAACLRISSNWYHDNASHHPLQAPELAVDFEPPRLTCRLEMHGGGPAEREPLDRQPGLLTLKDEIGEYRLEKRQRILAAIAQGP